LRAGAIPLWVCFSFLPRLVGPVFFWLCLRTDLAAGCVPALRHACLVPPASAGLGLSPRRPCFPCAAWLAGQRPGFFVLFASFLFDLVLCCRFFVLCGLLLPPCPSAQSLFGLSRVFSSWYVVSGFRVCAFLGWSFVFLFFSFFFIPSALMSFAVVAFCYFLLFL